MPATEICKSCIAYIPGRVCKNGFPLPFGESSPMCLRGDYSDSQMKRFFDKNGKPVFFQGGR